MAGVGSQAVRAARGLAAFAGEAERLVRMFGAELEQRLRGTKALGQFQGREVAGEVVYVHEGRDPLVRARSGRPGTPGA